jgi:3-oxoacyl-[acyl-carrier-protein] synthase-3
MSAACVTGLGVHVPSQRTTAEQIGAASGLPVDVVIHKLGIREKAAPGVDDHPTAMAVLAARHALAEAGIEAAQVDVVISMTEEHKEYPVWTSGIKLGHDLGAANAYAFDLGQKCGTGVLGLKLARDLIRADPHVNTVLLAGGYRNGDLIDYRDPNVRFMYNLAAGAGAAVIERDRPGHEILGASILTDGSLSEDVLVPVGGTKTALTAANLDQFRLQVPHPQAMRERLAARSVANFLHVIRQAVERSQATTADIAYMALLHMKRSAHDEVLELLDVPAERSIYLEHYGHIGQVDQILSLVLARENARLAHGDLAVLVAAGVGYVWNALCLRWHAEATA